MRQLTGRSDFNVNNMARYSEADRAIDRAREARYGRPNITPIIGLCNDDKPTFRPLRDLASGKPAQSRGMRVRVYAGGLVLGMALSQQTMLALIERGYLESDEVTVKGTIDGQPVEATIDEASFDEFKAEVA